MKHIFVLPLALFVFACSGTGDQQQKQNIAIIEKYIKAVQEKDTQTMSDLLADNYIGYGPSFSDSINKLQIVLAR